MTKNIEQLIEYSIHMGPALTADVQEAPPSIASTLTNTKTQSYVSGSLWSRWCWGVPFSPSSCNLGHPEATKLQDIYVVFRSRNPNTHGATTMFHTAESKGVQQISLPRNTGLQLRYTGSRILAFDFVNRFVFANRSLAPIETPHLARHFSTTI